MIAGYLDTLSRGEPAVEGWKVEQARQALEGSPLVPKIGAERFGSASHAFCPAAIERYPHRTGSSVVPATLAKTDSGASLAYG